MSNRILAWTDEALGSYVYWQKQDKKTLKRINKLIKAAKSTPFDGIGKPEPLKENLFGFWSRRIDDTNELKDNARIEAATQFILHTLQEKQPQNVLKRKSRTLVLMDENK